MAQNVASPKEKKPRLAGTPNAGELRKLLAAKERCDTRGAEARGEYGKKVQDAEKVHNLHRRAWAGIVSLTKMAADPVKLREYLYHFDAMRAALGIDAMAGDDMLPDRQKPDGADAKPAKGGKAAKPAKGKKGEKPAKPTKPKGKAGAEVVKLDDHRKADAAADTKVVH